LAQQLRIEDAGLTIDARFARNMAPTRRAIRDESRFAFIAAGA